MSRSGVTLAVMAVLAVAAVRPAHGQDAQNRLWEAARAGDTTAIRRAIADGAKVDSLDTTRSRNGRLALNWAALNNHPAAIHLLLSLGAPLEAENLTGFTALHHAAESGSLEAAEALLAAGADVEHANGVGRRPIDTARAQGYGSVVALLEAAERGERPRKQ
jgi:ankyrin repeat protein